MSDKEENKTVKGWTSFDGGKTFSAKKAKPPIHEDILPPGYYSIGFSPFTGLYFEGIDLKNEDLVKVPGTKSDNIINGIKTFWNRRGLFEKYNFPYKRGILMYGPPGCHAQGTKVIMFDGSSRNVEDVKLGDLLMGPDSKPREVLRLIKGNEELYKITPVNGKPFVVNKRHILSLKRSGERDKVFPGILNVSVEDFLQMSKPSQQRFKLYRPSQIDFNQEKTLPINPYFLGVWLGDGTSSRPEITTADKEIKDFLYAYADSLNLKVTSSKPTPNNRSITYALVKSAGKHNILLDKLREIEVLNNKHIPFNYLTSSLSDRLELLAGIIDTDGSYAGIHWRDNEKLNKKGWKGYFEVFQKSDLLANQIVFLARSLGFRAFNKKATKKIKGLNFAGEYNRVTISGDLGKIPVKLARKKALQGKPNKDHLVTGIKSVESIQDGDYYGFTLSDDHLYLTDDFVVHHNCGKTCTISLLCQEVIAMNGICLKFMKTNLLSSGLKLIREQQEEVPILVIMEDLDQLLGYNNLSELLNMLDGVSSPIQNIIYLATTNNPEELHENIRNRPSRFDKRILFGPPEASLRKGYIESLLGKDEDVPIDVDYWVKETEGLSFAHLKELFVSNILFGNDFTETLQELRLMGQVSDEDSIDSEEMEELDFQAEEMLEIASDG